MLYYKQIFGYEGVKLQWEARQREMCEMSDKLNIMNRTQWNTDVKIMWNFTNVNISFKHWHHAPKLKY